MDNYAYILKCSDGTFYCGWTNDLGKRLKAHNEGHGAKYTRGRGPVELCYWEPFSTKEEAMRREYALKQLSRREKEKLTEGWKKKQEEEAGREGRTRCDQPGKTLP